MTPMMTLCVYMRGDYTCVKHEAYTKRGVKAEAGRLLEVMLVSVDLHMSFLSEWCLIAEIIYRSIYLSVSLLVYLFVCLHYVRV